MRSAVQGIMDLFRPKEEVTQASMLDLLRDFQREVPGYNHSIELAVDALDQVQLRYHFEATRSGMKVTRLMTLTPFDGLSIQVRHDVLMDEFLRWKKYHGTR